MIHQKNKPEIIRVAHLIDNRVKYFKTAVTFGIGMHIKPDVRFKAISEGRLTKMSGPNMGIWRVEIVKFEYGEQYFKDNEEPIQKIVKSTPKGKCCECGRKTKEKNDEYCHTCYNNELGVELQPSLQRIFQTSYRPLK